MATAYLLLGTNMGCRADHLKTAVGFIRQRAGSLQRQSTVYETAAWGKIKQADYLNQVLQIETNHAPAELLTLLSAIEHEMGRVRQERWGPRIIDIDILLYEQQVSADPKLTLPHPYIPKRRFVLTPLAEIAPDLIHPVLHQTIADLLEACTDPLWVEPYAAVHTP